MTVVLRPGEIRVTAIIVDGVVRDVLVESDRPVAIIGALLGRPVSEVAGIMASLHGLCGQSHAAAIRFAAAAASGTPVPGAEISDWATRLAAERIGEHLRSLVLAGALTAASMREALAVAGWVARNGAAEASVLVQALDRLGLDKRPDPEACGADVLRPEDDAAVVTALATDPAFSRAPHLPGRGPETGPAARFNASAANPAAAIAARFAEVDDARAALTQTAGWITAGPAGNRAGYAAVETPRGRLYYRLVVAPDGTLTEGRSLAPTEWNFHPNGPAARALVGFRPDGDPVAAITERAAAFDPCVACRVTVRQAADA